jgi:hypothetical protein
VAVGVVQVGRAEAVAFAAPGDPAEQSLGGALPGHLGELVDGADQQGRQQPVDLLVDHHDRQALAGPPAGGERARPGRVAAEQQGAAPVQIDADVAGLVDLGPAPRAGGELGG